MRNVTLFILALAVSPVSWASSGNDPMKGIRHTLEIYAQGAKNADVGLMAQAFSSDASIHGYMDPQMDIAFNGPIQILFDEVKNGGPMPNLQHVISSIEVKETIATARVDETGWVVKKPNAPAEERAFTDMYTLMKTKDQNNPNKEYWVIISKVFYTYPKN